jgi:hypothetical protein
MRREHHFCKSQCFKTKAPSIALFLTLLLSCSLIWVQILSGGQSGQTVETAGLVIFTPYRFVVGNRNIYELVYENHSSSDLRGLLGDDKSSGVRQKETPPGFAFSFKTTVRGELAATVLDKKVDTVLITYTLRNPIVTFITNGQNSGDQAEAIRNDLEKDIFAIVNPQGKILYAWFDPSVRNLSQTYARGLLALTQFVFPAKELTKYDQWVSEEEDPSGQYVAAYRMIKGKAKDASETPLKLFYKKKTRYLEYLQKSRMEEIVIPTIIIPHGNLLARFDFASGTLSSLGGSESQDFLISRKKVGHGASTVTITFLRKEQLNELELSSLRNIFSAREKTVAPVSLLVRPSQEETETAIQKKELGDETLESLLAELGKAESAKDPNFDSTSLYLKFKALVYIHPESCVTLGKVLSIASAGSLTMSILPNALSMNGHPQAQASLVEAIRAHSQDKSALFSLIPALATVDEPTPESVKTLMDLAFNSQDSEIVSAAQLALGAQVRRLARSSPESADKVVDRFIQEIKASSSPNKTQQLLLALGNAGSVRALPEISRFARGASPDLRTVALYALRFIDSPEAEAVLVSALTSDKENSVRLAAADALSFRKMTQTTFKAQYEVFSMNSDVNVRLIVLQNLWKAHEAFPEVRRLVKRAAAKDPSTDIRKAAGEIVTQYGKEYFK